MMPLRWRYLLQSTPYCRNSRLSAAWWKSKAREKQYLSHTAKTKNTATTTNINLTWYLRPIFWPLLIPKSIIVLHRLRRLTLQCTVRAKAAPSQATPALILAPCLQEAAVVTLAMIQPVHDSLIVKRRIIRMGLTSFVANSTLKTPILWGSSNL